MLNCDYNVRYDIDIEYTVEDIEISTHHYVGPLSLDHRACPSDAY